MRCCVALFIAVLTINSCIKSIYGQNNGSTQAQCRVTYKTGAKQPPLLFGGVYTSCKSGCQSRNDTWSEPCNWRNTSNTPLTFKCQLHQTPGIVAALKQLEGDGLSQFSPCELHQYLKGRTLWVIGDSMMRNIYYALRCFMTDFWDHSLGECAATPNTTLLKEIFQAADTNHTSVMGHHALTDMPGCVHLLEGGRICWINSVRGEEFAASKPGEPSLLKLLYDKVAAQRDIFFINFGRWHFNNCAGLQLDTYRRSLRQLAAFYKGTRESFPNLVYRVTAHDHSACPRKKTTVWVTPPAAVANTTPAGSDSHDRLQAGNSSSSGSGSNGSPAAARGNTAGGVTATNDNTVAAAPNSSSSSKHAQEPDVAVAAAAMPQAVAGLAASQQQAKPPKKKSFRFAGECLPAHQGNYSLGIGSMLQSEAEKLLSSAGVPIIDNYSMTRQLHKAHIFMEGAGWDCNHWCSPGVPEWEIYTLFKAFKQYNIQPLPPAAVAKTQPRCVPVVIQGTPPEGWMPRPAAVGVASQQDALPYGGLMYSNY